jgi:hypothetical protein
MNSENPQKISVKLVGVPAEIPTGLLLNTPTPRKTKNRSQDTHILIKHKAPYHMILKKTPIFHRKPMAENVN